MSENNGFIKKFRSSKSKELKRKHTSAFLILDTLAENAKRNLDSGHPLLEIGEGIVTAEECGLSSQEFETGVKYLVNNEMVELLHRGRKDKNSKLELRVHPESTQSSPRITSRITSRINGTVLKLLDTDIYDPNFQQTPNHIPKLIPDSPRINSEFTPNKEEIKNKEIKEEQYISREALKKNNFLIEEEYLCRKPKDSVCEKVIGLDFVNEKFEESLSHESRSDQEPKSPFLQHNVYSQSKLSETNTEKNEIKSNKTEKKESKPKQEKHPPSEVAISLNEFFYESLATNLPEQRSIPTTPKKRTETARHFDKILKTYSESEIRQSIKYGHSNAFWLDRGIIKNPRKLEEHMGTLLRQLHQLEGKSHETIKGNFKRPTPCQNATFKPNPRKFLDANAEP